MQFIIILLHIAELRIDFICIFSSYFRIDDIPFLLDKRPNCRYYVWRSQIRKWWCRRLQVFVFVRVPKGNLLCKNPSHLMSKRYANAWWFTDDIDPRIKFKIDWITLLHTHYTYAEIDQHKWILHLENYSVPAFIRRSNASYGNTDTLRKRYTETK